MDTEDRHARCNQLYWKGAYANPALLFATTGNHNWVYCFPTLVVSVVKHYLRNGEKHLFRAQKCILNILQNGKSIISAQLQLHLDKGEKKKKNYNFYKICDDCECIGDIFPHFLFL